MRRASDLRTLWALARLCEAAGDVAGTVTDRFPQVRVAIFAYEIQVPPAVSIGLLAAGVRTVASQERPGSAVQVAVPKILDTYLTASPLFSEGIRRSPVAMVRNCRSVGMWRTDLLRDYRSLEAPELVSQARGAGLHPVICLPFHIAPDAASSSMSLELSWSTARRFLTDILMLALDHPDCFFIIRGKNADWLEQAIFADIVAMIADAENVRVDTEYDELNWSYRLCAHADAIIARHTSLVDECLAVGIPSVLHDFSHNQQRMYADLFSYLPDPLWAQDYVELGSKLDFALSHGGEAFSDWWDPLAPEIFGGLADGHVRQRSREVLDELIQLGETQSSLSNLSRLE